VAFAVENVDNDSCGAGIPEARAVAPPSESSAITPLFSDVKKNRARALASCAFATSIVAALMPGGVIAMLVLLAIVDQRACHAPALSPKPSTLESPAKSRRIV